MSSDRKELLNKIEEQFLKLTNLFKEVHSTPFDFGCGELLYPAEIHTLECIERNSEITVTDLAEKMGVTKGAISQIKKKLIDKQLLQKKDVPGNRKKFTLSLTQKGELACEGHCRYHEKMNEYVDAALYDVSIEAMQEYHQINNKILNIMSDKELMQRLQNL